VRQKRHLVQWAALGALIACTTGALPAWSADANKAVDDYNFAAWLYNTGKYSLAVESYEAFLKNHPDHAKLPDARFGLAQSHFHLDAFAKAIEQYTILRDDYPDFPQRAEARFQLGQSQVALEQFAPAEATFQAVVEQHADHYLADWAMARRAACLTSLGRHAEAEALLLPLMAAYHAENRSPGDMPATKAMLEKLDAAGVKAGGAFLGLIERSMFTLGLAQFNQDHFSDAEASFARFLKSYPTSPLSAEARFRMAQARYRQGAYAAAAEAYAALGAGTGEFAAVSAFERGLSLYKAGNLAAASDAFADMAARFPDDPQAPKATLYSGTFRYETGDYADAIARLAPLAEKGQTLADEAAYWIAMARYRQNKPDEARQAFEAALAAYPRSALAGDMKLGLADVQLAVNDYTAAAASFEDYARTNPQHGQAPRALYSAAVALHRADLFERADAVCKTFLDRYAKDALAPDVLFLSGENRFLANAYPAAAECYQAFLAHPGAAGDRVPRAHFRMAWIHHAAKQFQPALDAIARIDLPLAGAVVAAEARYLEGVCQFELAANDRAIAALEAYLKAPDHSRFGDDALLKIAMARQRRGEIKSAVEALKRFLKEYPKSELGAHAQFQLAERYADLKDFGQAAKQYQAVVERADAKALAPYALFGLGVASYDQGNWAAAADAFARLTAQFPDSELTPQAFYRRGRALMKAAQWADAAAAFDALLAAAPRDALARSAQVNAAACHQELKQWSAAAAAYRAAIEKYDPAADQSRLFYELAWSQREAGQMDAALKAFRKMTEQFPADPLTADAFFHLGEDAYKAADGSDATADKAHRRGRFDAARDLYEKALALSADKRLTDKALYRIGWCEWQTDRFAEAATTFDRLIADCPASELLPDALFQAGLAHARYGNRELAQARMDRLTTDAAFAAFPYQADALLALGDYRLAANDPAAALKTFEDFLAKNADHADAARAWLLKGKALYALKRYDAALTSLTESTKLTRSAVAAEAQFYIGQTHQIRSDFNRAVTAYLRVQALYAAEREWCAAAAFECAKCYAALDRTDEATATLRAIVNQYPDTQWAKLAAARLK
jgi:cellulose synthase operon protein C